MDRKTRQYIDQLVKESINEGKWGDRAAAVAGTGALLFGALNANFPETPEDPVAKDALDQIEFENYHENDKDWEERENKNNATPKSFFHNKWKYDDAVKESKKRIYNLTESQLSNIISESVKQILNKRFEK